MQNIKGLKTNTNKKTLESTIARAVYVTVLLWGAVSVNCIRFIISVCFCHFIAATLCMLLF